MRLKQKETQERLHLFLQRSPMSMSALRPGPERRASLHRGGFLNSPDRPFTWDEWDDTFNDLVPNGQGRTVAQVMLDWLLLLQENPRTKQFIWLYGPTGVGKTHIACVTAMLWSLAHDVEAAYCNWSTRLAEIKDSFNGWAASEGLIAEQTADILVMDDMGAERVTLYNLECLYRIVESRRGRPTIFTANYRIADYLARLHASHRRDDDAKAVHYQALKIEDRLQTGQGGYLLCEVSVLSKQGSYRRLA